MPLTCSDRGMTACQCPSGGVSEDCCFDQSPSQKEPNMPSFSSHGFIQAVSELADPAKGDTTTYSSIHSVIKRYDNA